MITIIGNTFPVKEELKALGARWNKEKRGWDIEDRLAAKARAIVARGAVNILDPYTVLGVTKQSTTKQIREAWISLVALYHPDKVRHLGPELQDFATKKTQELNTAYAAIKGH